jgi:YrbI family 3-deoxy-D-manno-octulosonate 8-phosphate phosphatase
VKPDGAKVRLLCLDVDGVLTDGSISIGDDAVETKRFHVRDGTGLRLWMEVGHEVAIITSRSGMAVRHRATELGIKHVLQGVPDKHAALRQLLDELHLDPQAAAAVGDDLPDLPMLRAAGYPVAVGDAAPEVRQVAAFVTVRPGGLGAVREVVEHLLKLQGRWEEALEAYA